MPGQAENKPVNERIGFEQEGNFSAYALEFFEPNPSPHRILRERRRFKVRPEIFICKQDVYDGEGNFSYSNEDNMGYYEDCELTLDTVANPSYPAKELEKVLDHGGDFCHSIIKYANWKVAAVDDYFSGETIQMSTIGNIRCIPRFGYPTEEDNIGYRIEPLKEVHDLTDLGPGLWAAMRPTKPIMDLGVAIAELRDIPRMLRHAWTSIKSVTALLDNPKGLPQWILASEFGWKPLYADLKRTLKLRGEVEKRLNFIKENANKSLHRITPKRPWQPKVTEEVIGEWESDEDDSPICSLSFDSVPESADPSTIPLRFKSSLKLRTTVTTGATGMFRYYWDGDIPDDDYLRARLLGIVLTERVAWEAMPWSWLIDWFSNAGEVLSNLKDHLDETTVAPIAYAQKHIVQEYTWTCTNGYYTTSVQRIFDTKIRRKIDPFGLAADVALSDIQKVILAALSLTRV